jgi:hypothetical protein
MARAAVATEEELLGPEHPSLGPSFRVLGQIRRDRGDLDEADAPPRRSLARPPARGAASPPFSTSGGAPPTR